MSWNSALRTFSYLVTNKSHSVYNTFHNCNVEGKTISTASMTNWSDSEHTSSSASGTDFEFAGDSSDSDESIEIEGQQDIQD